jgi:hypothetical protein
MGCKLYIEWAIFYIPYFQNIKRWKSNNNAMEVFYSYGSYKPKVK